MMLGWLSFLVEDRRQAHAYWDSASELATEHGDEGLGVQRADRAQPADSPAYPMGAAAGTRAGDRAARPGRSRAAEICAACTPGCCRGGRRSTRRPGTPMLRSETWPRPKGIWTRSVRLRWRCRARGRRWTLARLPRQLRGAAGPRPGGGRGAGACGEGGAAAADDAASGAAERHGSGAGAAVRGGGGVRGVRGVGGAGGGRRERRCTSSGWRERAGARQVVGTWPRCSGCTPHSSSSPDPPHRARLGDNGTRTPALVSSFNRGHRNLTWLASAVWWPNGPSGRCRRARLGMIRVSRCVGHVPVRGLAVDG